MRGSVSHLVATAWDYDEARLYALHRFRKVEMLEDAVETPKETLIYSTPSANV